MTGYCVSYFKFDTKMPSTSVIFLSSSHFVYNVQHFLNWLQIIYYASMWCSSHSHHVFSNSWLHGRKTIHTQAIKMNTKVCIQDTSNYLNWSKTFTDTMLSTTPTLLHTAGDTCMCVNTRAMQSECDSFSHNIFHGLMDQSKRVAL